jgi:hypothetical protein
VGTATTDSNGIYTKTVGPGWTGTVVPSISYGIYYNYSPSYRTHAAVTDPVTDQNYEVFPMVIFFNNQPGNTQVGQPISPGLIVALTAATPGVTITVALGANPGGGTLTGAGTYVTGSDGTVTITGLSINGVGSGYTIVATAGGRTVSTLPFDIY